MLSHIFQSEIEQHELRRSENSLRKWVGPPIVHSIRERWCLAVCVSWLSVCGSPCWCGVSSGLCDCLRLVKIGDQNRRRGGWAVACSRACIGIPYVFGCSPVKFESGLYWNSVQLWKWVGGLSSSRESARCGGGLTPGIRRIRPYARCHATSDRA